MDCGIGPNHVEDQINRCRNYCDDHKQKADVESKGSHARILPRAQKKKPIVRREDLSEAGQGSTPMG